MYNLNLGTLGSAIDPTSISMPGSGIVQASGRCAACWRAPAVLAPGGALDQARTSPTRRRVRRGPVSGLRRRTAGTNLEVPSQ